MCVRRESSYSSFLPVQSGVPQGSIIGPLLFILYINDLPSTVPRVGMFIFADDTKLLKRVASEMTKQLFR